MADEENYKQGVCPCVKECRIQKAAIGNEEIDNAPIRYDGKKYFCIYEKKNVKCSAISEANRRKVGIEVVFREKGKWN